MKMEPQFAEFGIGIQMDRFVDRGREQRRRSGRMPWVVITTRLPAGGEVSDET